MVEIEYKTDTVALQKLLIEKGINTNTELAQKSDVDRNVIGKVLKGKIQPSAPTMYKLAACLEMQPTQAGKIFFSIHLRNK